MLDKNPVTQTNLIDVKESKRESNKSGLGDKKKEKSKIKVTKDKSDDKVNTKDKASKKLKE